MRVLHVIADPKPPEESVTRQLADTLMTAIVESNPIVRLTRVDLYRSPPPYIDYTMYRYFRCPLYDPVYVPSEAEKNSARYVLEQCVWFNRADLIVLSAPMWNFSLPAIMKAWFDAVLQPGQVYDMTPSGIEVYHTIKKAVLLTSSASVYSESDPSECLARLVRSLFARIKVCDVSIIWAQGQGIQSLRKRKSRKDKAIKSAREEGVAIATHMV